MSANAIETLRVAEGVLYASVDVRTASSETAHYEHGVALAAVEALLEAAKMAPGHSGSCDGREYPCGCGYDALAAAVRRVETGQ